MEDVERVAAQYDIDDIVVKENYQHQKPGSEEVVKIGGSGMVGKVPYDERGMSGKVNDSVVRGDAEIVVPKQQEKFVEIKKEKESVGYDVEVASAAVRGRELVEVRGQPSVPPDADADAVVGYDGVQEAGESWRSRRGRG